MPSSLKPIDNHQADQRFQSFLESRIGDRKLRIAVTGSNGMIGRRLIDRIASLGHQPIRILRPESSARSETDPNVSSVVLDSKSGFSYPSIMEELDAVVHLAGKGIADHRWTPKFKEAVRASRVEGTHRLVEHLAKLQSPPKALVCASGVGIYGERGSETLDESASPGSDFLASVAFDWEKAAKTYGACGRVAVGRLGVVMHPDEGALSKMLPLFRLGLGGRIGDGRQYWSWIHVDDAVAAFLFMAADPNAQGAYNLVAPQPVTNEHFAQALGHALHRPTWLPAPAWLLRGVLGEMADGMLLTSTRAECKRLTEASFPFRAEKLEDCFEQLFKV